MKTIHLFPLLCLFTTSAFAQMQESNEVGKSISNKLLIEIDENFESNSKSIDSSINAINEQLRNLDRVLVTSRSTAERTNTLHEIVKALEERQIKMELEPINIFQSNLNTAVASLIALEQDIKPLQMFVAAKDFYGSLEKVNNPMSYPGYKEWFEKFKQYVEKEKDKDPTLNVLSSMISLGSGLVTGTPLAGPIVEPLFAGIASYIGSLGSGGRKADLKKQSQDMFLLTAKIAQFSHEKSLIDGRSSAITQQFDELQKEYQAVLEKTLGHIAISPKEFNDEFSGNINPLARVNYVNSLIAKSSQSVLDNVAKNPKDWKNSIYAQMMDVQDLRLSFGELTSQIMDNIKQYKVLVSNYEKDPQIGQEVSALVKPLHNLEEQVSKFRSAAYTSYAKRMYKLL